MLFSSAVFLDGSGIFALDSQDASQKQPPQGATKKTNSNSHYAPKTFLRQSAVNFFSYLWSL